MYTIFILSVEIAKWFNFFDKIGMGWKKMAGKQQVH